MNKITFDGKLHVYLEDDFPWKDDRVPVLRIAQVSPEDFSEIINHEIDFKKSENVKLRCEKCRKIMEKESTPLLVYVNPEHIIYIFFYCSLNCKNKDEPNLQKKNKIKIN